jgi:hypothetical protein
VSSERCDSHPEKIYDRAVSWLEYLSSGWTLVVVPTAIAIAALVGFVKTLLEKRNLELQNQKLQVEVEAATSRIVLATDEQVEKYAFRRHFMKRTIRLASVLLAVALPTTLVLNTQLRQEREAGPTPIVRPAPPKNQTEAPRRVPVRSLPIGRWEVRGPHTDRVSEIEFFAGGRLTGTSGTDRRTTAAGSWDGVTGKLIARGELTTQPVISFECDLVYVNNQQSPRSSYVIANCSSASDRWKWELTPAASATKR